MPMREIEMVNMAGEGAAEAAAPLRRAPRRMTAKQKRSVYGFVTAALPLVGYLVFNIVPLGIAIATMFVSMDGYDFGSMQWNNFQTFRDAFSDSRFLHSLGVSFLFIVPHLCGLVLILYALWVIVPFLVLLITSVTPETELNASMHFIWWPQTFTLEAYSTVLVNDIYAQFLYEGGLDSVGCGAHRRRKKGGGAVSARSRLFGKKPLAQAVRRLVRRRNGRDRALFQPHGGGRSLCPAAQNKESISKNALTDGAANTPGVCLPPQRIVGFKKTALCRAALVCIVCERRRVPSPQAAITAQQGSGFAKVLRRLVKSTVIKNKK